MKHNISIGYVARTLGVSTQAVRYYEMAGVVKPQRDSTGRRLFSEAQVKTLQEYRAQFGSTGSEHAPAAT